MNKLFLGIALLFAAVSCDKIKDDKCDQEKKETCDNLTYYSEDYKKAEFNVLGVSSLTIDALWVEFYSKESKDYTHYALIVKSNGEFVKENGTCVIDWEQKITFTPDGGDTYEGTWLFEKEKYTVNLSEDGRDNELTFVYKETKDYGCGKK